MNAALSWVPGIEREETGTESGRKHIQSARLGRGSALRDGGAWYSSPFSAILP
jgi:hypothetical protein